MRAKIRGVALLMESLISFLVSAYEEFFFDTLIISAKLYRKKMYHHPRKTAPGKYGKINVDIFTFRCVL